MNIIYTFIFLSIINVVFSTVRSIVLIKGGRLTASLTSGGYFAFYNIVLVYSVADFPMWQKCVITFACNVIGVYLVKVIEDRMRKDRLWQIVCNFHTTENDDIIRDLDSINATYNYVVMGKHTRFEIYTATQSKSHEIAEIVRKYNGKYFINENKATLY